MTTEIEKQFFDAFGFEPYDRYYNCKLNLEGECKPEKSCCACEHSEDVYCYPQISDKQYLELICIANHEDVYIEIVGTDVETMKNELLKNFIHFKSIIPKHQVQAIFEGKDEIPEAR